MKKITVINPNGTKEEVDLVRVFEVKDLKRRFAMISKGERLDNNMRKVYMSEIIEDSPTSIKLIGITDESVWDKVKQAMREVVQGG